MLAPLLAALSAAFAAGASPPMPTVVNLCNETPVNVAYMVARPTGRGLHTQRGWFTVAPGECLSGAIGDGRAGEAFVHARSGSFVWPPEGPARQCVSEGGMSRAARTPPCDEAEREAPVASVAVFDRRNSYLIEHTARCRDLPAGAAALCESGLRAPDGFAELVRTLEICNTGGSPLRAIGAGEAGAPGSVVLSAWTVLEAGACAPVWRGQTRSRTAYVRVESRGEAPWAEDDARLCVPAQGEAAGRRAAPGAACAADDRALAFRAVEFGADVSTFTADYALSYGR
ncbi:MAG: DUF1036 domain-containing protein [Oceanicaulis sp.]